MTLSTNCTIPRQPDSSVHSRRCSTSQPLLAASLISLTLLLGACSSSSDDDADSDTVNPSDPLLTTLSDDELKQNALNNFGDNMNSGFNAADDVSVDTLTTLPGELEPGNNNDSMKEPVDSSLIDLISSSIALNDDSGDRTTREGNLITIDPDETEVCAEDASGNLAQSEIERCETLVRDMTVILDSSSETAGTISYFFQDQPVANIGYSDTSDSLEIFLAGLNTLSDADKALDPESRASSSASTVTGAIRLSSTSTTAADGSEAGSLSLAVTQPVNLADSDSSSASIGTGTLFSFSVDESDDTGSIEFDIGKLLINQVREFDDGETEVIDFDLDGFTAIIDLNSGGDALTVSNLSLGNGPFIIAVDTEKVFDISLDALGFTISEENGEITINSDLNLSAFANEAIGEDVVNVSALATMLQIMAPAGTRLAEQDNGSVLVLSGGPLGYTLTEPDVDEIPLTTSVTVAAGQCLGEAVQGFEDVPAIVTCDE